LANLSGLKNLKRVYLWQTKVTDKGVADLKKAVANLYVNRGEELAIVVAPPPAEPAKPDPKAAAAAAAAKPINTVCPVSGKPVDPTKTLVHEGKVIGFCCDMCPKAFQKDPAKFAANIKADAKPEEKKPVEAKPAEKKPEEKKPEEKKVAAAPGTPVNAKCPVSEKDITPGFVSTLDGKTVGFCCDKCLAKFAKEPQKYAAKVAAK
jgi:YHS domain-containing protein